MPTSLQDRRRGDSSGHGLHSLTALYGGKHCAHSHTHTAGRKAQLSYHTRAPRPGAPSRALLGDAQTRPACAGANPAKAASLRARTPDPNQPPDRRLARQDNCRAGATAPQPGALQGRRAEQRRPNRMPDAAQRRKCSSSRPGMFQTILGAAGCAPPPRRAPPPPPQNSRGAVAACALSARPSPGRQPGAHRPPLALAG